MVADGHGGLGGGVVAWVGGWVEGWWFDGEGGGREGRKEEGSGYMGGRGKLSRSGDSIPESKKWPRTISRKVMFMRLTLTTAGFRSLLLAI